MTTVPQYTATTTADGTVTTSSPLHFSLNTDPDPVRVSQPAHFVLVGSRRSVTPIECRKITVTVPTGNNSHHLTPNLGSVSPQISLPDWTPATNTATKTITFTPTSGHAEIGRDHGVTVQLMSMPINAEVGSAELRIGLEWRDAGYGDDEPWVTGTTIFDIGKFPPSFHLANFKAEELIIDNGDSVTLTWEARGVSSLKLLYDAAEISVIDWTTWTISNISHTTVFYLRATVQVGNNTVERTLSTTVTVRVPDLEVRTLTVLRSITASGNISTTDGNISTTAGTVSGKNVTATTVTATGDISTTNGNISTINGTVSGRNISATAGTVTATGQPRSTAVPPDPA
jgi:hypothetical protein